jgi:cobalt-zinc-cadmium efflux system outer membrane protein
MKAAIAVLGLGVALAGQSLTLAQLEQLALAHNPTLRQARDAVSAAAGAARQAGLWPNPTVGYEGAQIRGGSFGGGEQGGFVQQKIVLGGKLRAAKNAALAGEQRQRALAQAQRQAVTTAVQLAFYDALAAEQRVALRRELLAIAQDAATTSRQLYNVGQADAPDELRAAVEAEAAALDLERAQEQQQAAWRTLAATVGEPEMGMEKLAGRLEPGPKPIDTANYLAGLLSRSPAIAAARAGVAQAEAELTSARQAPIPDLQLGGGVEDNREQLAGGAAGVPPRAAGLQGFATAGVTLPLFNRNQGNIAAAAAQLDRSREELARVQLALRARAAPELADYTAAARAAGEYQKTMLPQSEQAFHMLLGNYRAMYAPYAQVLAAQRSWRRLQIANLDALERLWRSALSLRGLLLTQGLTAPAGEETMR